MASGMMQAVVFETAGSGVWDSCCSKIDNFSATVVDDVSEFSMAEDQQVAPSN